MLMLNPLLSDEERSPCFEMLNSQGLFTEIFNIYDPQMPSDP
jgi:hypothetical protein